jgi:hypothetical protein
MSGVEAGEGSGTAAEAIAPSPPLASPSTAGPIAHKREDTRRLLALGLAALLGVVGLLLIILTAEHEISLSDAKDLALAIYSPIVVLASTALGFYFGVQQDGR